MIMKTEYESYYVLSLNDLIHSESEPAVVYENGQKEWWLFGHRHRENGPALEHEDGLQEWWFKGYRHRIDGHTIHYNDEENSRAYYLYNQMIERSKYANGNYKKNICLLRYMRHG